VRLCGSCRREGVAEVVAEMPLVVYLHILPGTIDGGIRRSAKRKVE